MSEKQENQQREGAGEPRRPHRREGGADIGSLSRRQFMWLTATVAAGTGATVLHLAHKRHEAEAEAARRELANQRQAPTLADAPSETTTQPAEDAEPVSTIDRDAWYLVLVNRDHPVESRDVELQSFGDGQAIDARCFPSMDRMIQAARDAGYSPTVFSSFRTREYQQQLLDSSIADLRAKGRTEEQARWEASRYIAQPGCSEHEVGLAIDITSSDCVEEYQTAHPEIYDWLNRHSWEFGWIRRYPEDKELITGIAYEPWHFRYVGEEAAREIYERGITLEEYLATA